MWRVLVGLGVVVFSLGALSGYVLIAMLIADGDAGAAGGVALGSAVFTWGAWACWRDWQRAQQEREFRRELATKDDRVAK